MSPNFSKIQQYQISWNPVQWPSSCCMSRDWQTRWGNKYNPPTFYSEHTKTWHQVSHIPVYTITWKHWINLLHFTFCWIEHFNTVHSPLTTIPHFSYLAYASTPKVEASGSSWNVCKIYQTARIISQKTVISIVTTVRTSDLMLKQWVWCICGTSIQNDLHYIGPVHHYNESTNQDMHITSW